MRLAASVLALSVAASACAAQPPVAPVGWRDAGLQAEAVEFSPPASPELQFAGGLDLHSKDSAFGGWSGLEAMPDGRLVAVSDAGSWLEARVALDGQGRLVGLADARLAPLVGLAGQPLPNKVEGDAEDVTLLRDGRFAVSFEQDHRIWIYDLAAGPGKPPKPGPAIPEANRLNPNEGLEALAEYGRALLAGAEHSPEGKGTWWWRLSSSDPAKSVGPLPAALSPSFSLVALDRLPAAFDGDYVALERFYAPFFGGRCRIRRISGEALAEGRFEGPVVLELSGPGVDNFEGVAAVEGPQGARLYIISDDNFSGSQRTLLYAFDWKATN